MKRKEILGLFTRGGHHSTRDLHCNHAPYFSETANVLQIQLNCTLYNSMNPPTQTVANVWNMFPATYSHYLDCRYGRIPASTSMAPSSIRQNKHHISVSLPREQVKLPALCRQGCTFSTREHPHNRHHSKATMNSDLPYSTDHQARIPECPQAHGFQTISESLHPAR